MAVQTITYGDKQFLNQNADIPATNKVQDTDMNEIKSVVNNNVNNIGDLSDLETSDTSSIVNAINELKNAEIYSTEEVKTNKIWIDGKPIYRKVIDLGTLGNKTSINVDGIYDTIVSFDGYIYLNDGGKLPLIEFNSTSFYRVISYDKPGNNSLKVVINRANVSNWDNWRLKIIVEYTKITE